MGDKQQYINFDEYIKAREPQKRERAEAWRVAIGLQAVDGLTTSEYLQDTARRNIEGEITIDEARDLIKQYYITKTTHDADDADKEEADVVSGNISKLLLTDAFTYSVAGIAAIHRAIFEGVFKHAGQFREYDISKKEWVLEGDSVVYARWQDIRMTLQYDLDQERQFVYTGLEKDKMVEHIARFVSGLWEIHPFGEGNTRTTSIFIIKYLRSLGFTVNNELFERHSWYFRNALVRANYKNAVKGIDYSPVYLERFFRNLLLGEQWDLRNRYLHIHPMEEWSVQPNLADPTSIGQAQDKCRTSAGQVQDKFHTDNFDIISLIKVIGINQLSVKDMMTGLGLKGRDNFLNLYLMPATREGYVRMLYPNSPRHPRQKYLLTVKGLALYNELNK
jgi:fido (protein-threonine AMPylation protein)